MTLAYLAHDQGKRFITSTTGACIIKLFTAIIYCFRNKLECLPLARQPSLVFRDKHSSLLRKP
jgi:hypothetical protein